MASILNILTLMFDYIFGIVNIVKDNYYKAAFLGAFFEAIVGNDMVN